MNIHKMKKIYALLLVTILFCAIRPRNADSQEKVRFLKAVILDQKLYLMSNERELAIAYLDSNQTRTIDTLKIVPNLPEYWQSLTMQTEPYLYWDVTDQCLYVSRQRSVNSNIVYIVPLPIGKKGPIQKSVDVSDKLDANKIPVRVNIFDMAYILKRDGFPFFASLNITEDGNRMVWLYQGNTLAKWISIPKWSSPPGTSAISYIVPPKEYKLKTNIPLPYIAYYDSGVTYIINVNGKVREFADGQFVENRFFKHERIPSSTPVEDVSIPDVPVILVLNKDTPKPSWLRFVVRDDIAQIAPENNGIADTNDTAAKNISNALNRALKALGKVEWRIDDIFLGQQKKAKSEEVPQTPPPPVEPLLWKELPGSKVEGTGLLVRRQKTPLTHIPEGFKKPKETLVPPPPGYLYWAEYHRWDDGFGYVSHYALWKREIDTQDKSAQLEILDAVYEPQGKEKTKPGTFAVAYVQGKVLSATETRPGKDDTRVEMPLQDTTLQANVTKKEIKSAAFTGNAQEGTLMLEVMFVDGHSKQWKLTEVNGKVVWE